MKVLMISSDRGILFSGSAVQNRMKEYGALVEELHIVVLSNKTETHGPIKISDKVFLYPTNSWSKFLRPIDAVGIGKGFKCDLVTAQDPFECGWVGKKLSQYHSIPLEVQLHTNPFSKNFSGLLNVFRKMIMSMVLPKASGVRVVLKSVGDKLQKKFSLKNVYTLPIFVEKERISKRPEFDLHEKFGFKKVALTVSRLSPEKNVDLAIEALSEVPEVGLVVVGSGPEEAMLKMKAESLNSKVAFVGWQEELSSYYKTADVFVQASDFEGYGLSLVEAGLSGVPVVTTRVGLAEELKDGEEVLIFEPKARALAKALNTLISDSNLRKGLVLGLQKALEARLLDKESYKAEMLKNWQKLLELDPK